MSDMESDSDDEVDYEYTIVRALSFLSSIAEIERDAQLEAAIALSLEESKNEMDHDSTILNNSENNSDSSDDTESDGSESMETRDETEISEINDRDLQEFTDFILNDIIDDEIENSLQNHKTNNIITEGRDESSEEYSTASDDESDDGLDESDEGIGLNGSYFNPNDSPLNLRIINRTDTILTNVTQTGNIGPVIEDPTIFECSICLESKPIIHSESFGCSHIFCNNCLTQHISSHVNDGKVDEIKCPEENCMKSSTDELIRVLLPLSLHQKYQDLCLKKATDVMEDIFYCPQCNKQVECDIGVCYGECLDCNFAFCTSCRKVFHGSDNCSNEESTQIRNQEELLSTSFINQSFKKCPGCHTNVEKEDGCNHMTCYNCSTEFCWLCLQAIASQNDIELHFSRCQLFSYTFED